MSAEKISEFLNNATTALAQKSYEVASKEYLNALKLDKNNLEALKGLGLCHFNLQEFDDGIKVFKKVLKLDENNATALYYLASLSILVEKTADAIAYSQKVIELRPDYFDAYKILFTLYLRMQKFTEISELHEKFLQNEVQAQDDTIHLVLGTTHMAKKKYKEAIEFFKVAREFSPQKEQITNNLGVCYMALKLYDEAIASFNKSLEINPNNALTYSDLGTVYQIKGDFLLAIDAFNKAFELAPDNFLNLLNIANLSNVLRKYDMAIAAYEKILAINPALKEIQTSLIGAYVKNNQPDKAINLIDVALKKTPRNVPLLFRKAKIYTDLGDFNTAMKVYEQILSFKKNSPTIYHAYAVLYTKMKDYDKAIKNLNKSITLDDTNAHAHKDLGIIYLLRNQVEYAKDEFELALKFGINDNEILKECADFYYSISNFAKADKLYRKSLQLENNPYTSLSLGINLIAQNKLEEAFATLEPLMAILPDEPELLYNIARIYFAQKDFDKAARLSKKAYFKIPTIEIANLLALSLKELEDYKGAADIFAKIIEQYPNNLFVYEDLVFCAKKIADKELLLKAYSLANDNFPYDEQRIITLIELLIEMNKKEEAKKILDKANFEHPSIQLKQILSEFQ